MTDLISKWYHLKRQARVSVTYSNVMKLNSEVILLNSKYQLEFRPQGDKYNLFQKWSTKTSKLISF